MGLTTQQIKENAPDGATHRTKARFYHFDERWGKWFVWRKIHNQWECLSNKPKGLKPL